MSDFLWPPAVVPNASEFAIVANTAAYVSPLSGMTRTVSRPGERWSCMLSVNTRSDAQRAAVVSLLARLRGQANRVWVPDHSARIRGSFPTGELLENPTFGDGTTGWTATYSTIAVTDSTLRLTVSAHSAAQYPNALANATLVSGAPYVGRAMFQNLSASVTVGVYAYGGADASEYSTAGLRTASFVSSSTSGSLSLVYQDTAATGATFDCPWASFARCALVSGGSQTGTRILIDGLPISSAGLLLPGDRVQIGAEVLVVTAPLNSDGGGAGYLEINRPLRAAPSDNAAVIIHQPLVRMMLTSNSVRWSNQPGAGGRALSSVTIELVEDIAA